MDIWRLHESGEETADGEATILSDQAEGAEGVIDREEWAGQTEGFKISGAGLDHTPAEAELVGGTFEEAELELELK